MGASMGASMAAWGAGGAGEGEGRGGGSETFGAGAAGVVVLTPPAMRAQASAIYMLCLNLVGIGLAPWLTAAITQYGFQDDLAVGKSCAIVAGGAAGLAALLFTWGQIGRAHV